MSCSIYKMHLAMQEINSNNTISLEHKFPETRAMRSGKQEWL